MAPSLASLLASAAPPRGAARRCRTGRPAAAATRRAGPPNAVTGADGAARFGSSCVSHGHVGAPRRRLVDDGRRRRLHVQRGRRDRRVEPLVVAVGEAALAGQPDEAALQLVAHLLLRVAVLGVRPLHVRVLRLHERHQHVVRAGGQLAALPSTGTVLRLSRTRAGIRRRSSAARPRSSAGDISRRAWVMNGSEAASVSSDERTPGSASRANARTLGSEAFSEPSAGCAARSVSRSSGIDASSATSSRAKAPAVTLKFVIRSLQRALVLDQRRERPRLALQHPLQVPRRVLPERRVVGQRAVAVGVLPVLDRLVEALGAAVRQALPAYSSRKVCRSSRVSRWSAVSRSPNCTGAAVCFIGIVPPSSSSARRGRAGLEVHEEVALEEDARPDLQLRVLVDRQALVLDLHRHARAAGGVVHRLDALDLADVDAGDPHRRVRLQVVRRAEDRLELVRVGERVGLREAEVA